MGYKEIYNEWLNGSEFDIKTKKELEEIARDELEIQDRFFKELQFGTAGMRGKLGAGTNRMNEYIVARATQGFAQYINKVRKDGGEKGVVIAHDNRMFSKEFARKSAEVLAGNGIKVYLFEDLRPTPELSFAIRYLNAIGGINITASHNPKEYNGYKVYWEEGSQILEDTANGIIQKIREIQGFSTVECAEKSDLINIIGEEIDHEYLKVVKSLALREEVDKGISVVYSPLNGAGSVSVQRILKERGFSNVHVVKEQEMPDTEFTTVDYPNPEDFRAFEYSMKLAQDRNGEILIATDPDCDRVGVIVRERNDEYVHLNGNQIGALLIDYILKTLKIKGGIPKNAVIAKSIVTGDLGSDIAKDYGVETINTLTGFKYICGKANEFEISKEKEFIFGYEESIGYVYGTAVRDKDAVLASMLVVEMAAYYKSLGKNLLEVLETLYLKYGYYREKQISIVLEGIEGKDKIDKMMNGYKTAYLKKIGDSKLVQLMDFESSIKYDFIKNTQESIDMPKSSGLKFVQDDGCWYAIRPSGTEPKIKIYVHTKGKSIQRAEDSLNLIEEAVRDKLKEIAE